MSTPTGQRTAFTLLELLIVVAVIGILAALAVPQLLAAQIRARVARVHEEQRLLAHMLELYFVDYDQYPRTMPPDAPAFHLQRRYQPLTTPLAYLSTVPTDPFGHRYFNGAAWFDLHTYPGGAAYVYARADTAGLRGTIRLDPDFFMLASAGPDKTLNQIYYYPPGQEDGRFSCPVCDPALRNQLQVVEYDPTNGIVSMGDIYRWNGGCRHAH